MSSSTQKTEKEKEREQETRCAVCGVASSLRCAQCGSAYYCGRIHQRRHWAGGHKAECSLKKKEKEKREGGERSSKLLSEEIVSVPEEESESLLNHGASTTTTTGGGGEERGEERGGEERGGGERGGERGGEERGGEEEEGDDVDERIYNPIYVRDAMQKGEVGFLDVRVILFVQPQKQNGQKDGGKREGKREGKGEEKGEEKKEEKGEGEKEEKKGEEESGGEKEREGEKGRWMGIPAFQRYNLPMEELKEILADPQKARALSYAASHSLFSSDPVFQSEQLSCGSCGNELTFPSLELETDFTVQINSRSPFVQVTAVPYCSGSPKCHSKCPSPSSIAAKMTDRIFVFSYIVSLIAHSICYSHSVQTPGLEKVKEEEEEETKRNRVQEALRVGSESYKQLIQRATDSEQITVFNHCKIRSCYFCQKEAAGWCPLRKCVDLSSCAPAHLVSMYFPLCDDQECYQKTESLFENIAEEG